MDKQEMAEQFENFLNETGNWQVFANWCDSVGIPITEFGLSQD